MIKQGYLYSTESEALEAIALINQGEGLPNNGFLTQTYCSTFQCNEGWYIEHDEITSKYLSNLTNVTINDPIL
jgi:hypothetical protein